MNRMLGLRHAEDRRSLAFAFCHFLVVATAASLWQRSYAAGFFVPFIAFSAFIQLVATHNALHSPVFLQRRVNRLWQCILSMGICYPASVFVPVHNLSHHMHLQTPKDILRTTEVRHRSNLLNQLHHMFMGTVHLHLLHAAYLRTMRRTHPRWFAQAACEALAAAVMLTLVGVLASPVAALVLVLLPCVMGQLIAVGYGYLHHDGTDPESDFNHSRNFTGRIFNWLTFNSGFHAIHHNHPGASWGKARAEHEARIAPFNHPALNQASILGYMWRVFFTSEGRRHYDGTPVRYEGEHRERELWTPADVAVTGAIETGASTRASAA